MTRIVKGRIIFDDERILLLREMVSKGRRKESKGCHETHERESLGGAVVKNHFFGSGIESWAVWGDFA